MSETTKRHGPNVRRLISIQMANLMVPSGGGLQAAVEALQKPGNIATQCRKATKLIKNAIAAVKAAPDNRFGDDDEVIAGEILRQIKEKEATRRPSG